MDDCKHFWRAVDSTRSQCAKCGEITSPEREREERKVEKPRCPYCGAEMVPVNYEGYYETMAFWECECEYFPDGVKANGLYT